LFLILVIKLDLVYFIIKLVRYISNFSFIYINIIKKIFKYLKDFINLDIYIKWNINNSYYINGYCNTDYTGDLAIYKSTSGYIFYIGNFPFI